MNEVENFHPVVERVLKDAILEEGYGDYLEVRHHFTTSTGEPDFVLLLKGIQRPVFVLEVKKTKSDCESNRFWLQTQEYVDTLSSNWAPGYYMYSGITNIEKLLVFCRRDGPVWGSLLAGNPYLDSEFAPPSQNNADDAISNLHSAIKDILALIMEKVQPNWAETWPLIIDSFKTNYNSIREYIELANPVIERDVTSYELLRIFLYGYLKEFYALYNGNHLKFFSRLPDNSSPPKKHALRLLNNFYRVLKLDFEQIFKDHPRKEIRLLPEKADKTLMGCLGNFISSVNSHLTEAMKENSTPGYFTRLLKDNVYDLEEMHKEGKITTDDELASILAELCIQDSNTKVMDIGTGVGALSSAAYNKLRDLSRFAKEFKTHNQLLSQISGIEKDPFLNQLATFRLIAKDPKSVTSESKIDFAVGDTFENPRPRQFDVVLMNPPYLRHDNKIIPITDEMEEHMLSAIERQQSHESFVKSARQPNLYFYFLNWAQHYLKSGGVAGIILMAKFLNNIDGEYVKEFILDDVDSILLYPRSFFKEFMTTTCIVVLKKGNSHPYVNFMRVKDPELLSDPHKINSVLDSSNDIINANYTLKRVRRVDLDPSENWLVYFTDPEDKREFLNNLDILVPLKSLFGGTASRGRAGNAGGSNTVFLRSPNNPLLEHVKEIEGEFIIPGLRVNKVSAGRRHFILEEDDVRNQEALGVPNKYENETGTGLPPKYQKYAGLKNYYDRAIEEHEEKWKNIVNDVYASEVIPDIIIPRADREKHSVYLWLNNEKIAISTNFFYLNGFKTVESKGDKVTQLKCICGYLMSSFGQVQFEIKANNQEGMRKLEGFMIDNFKCFDLNKLTVAEIEKVAKAFDDLNRLNEDVKGDEGVYTQRKELDKVVGEIIFLRNTGGFKSIDGLVDEFELFLEELVTMRAI